MNNEENGNNSIFNKLVHHPTFIWNDLRALSKEEIVEYFNRNGNKRFIELEKNPKCLIEANGDIKKVPLDQYHKISQDHPAWLDIRKNPFLWAASLFAQYLHIHFKGYEKELDLGPSMLSESDVVNIEWILRIYRVWASQTGDKLAVPPIPPVPPIPGIQLHGNMAVFCEYGKKHEANAIGIFLANNPNVVYRESGMIIMNKQMFDRLGLINPLTHMPFDWDKEICDIVGIIGVSPDGILDILDPVTKQVVDRSILECKCATPFIPDPKIGSIAGIDMRLVNNRNPYKNIKGYYLFQFMLQMTVCEVDHGYWTVYTPNRGQRVWRCGISKPLLAMMFALILYMCEEVKYLGFHKNPTISNDCPMFKFGYFKSDACPRHIATLHARMIDLVHDIVKSKNGNTLCSAYKEYTNVDEITRNIYGIEPTEQYPIANYYKLPYNYPPEIQSFTLMIMYCRMFAITDDFSEWRSAYENNIIPVGMSTSIRDRRHNVRVVLRCLPSIGNILNDAVEYILRDGEGVTDQTFLTFVTVRSRRVQNAENLINFFLSLYFQIICDSKNSAMFRTEDNPAVIVTANAFRATLNEKLKKMFASLLSLLILSDEFVSSDLFMYRLCKAPFIDVYMINKEARTVKMSDKPKPDADFTVIRCLRIINECMEFLLKKLEDGTISDARVKDNEPARGLPFSVLFEPVREMNPKPEISRSPPNVFAFAVYSVAYYITLSVIGSNTKIVKNEIDVEMCKL